MKYTIPIKYVRKSRKMSRHEVHHTEPSTVMSVEIKAESGGKTSI